MSASGRFMHDDGIQKGDVRTSINILVLGDDGVGKSSLISTFVSRHFSEVVPGLMTRVRLPPEPDSNCLTTIVDSQSGDTALISAIAKRTMNDSADSLSSLLQRKDTSSAAASSSSSYLEHVDSIVLVYDLDRIETFYRLENHWLPLIERCYSGELPVIVAGSKMDLVRPVTDEQALVRSRQQLVSLLQRFRFVRQCIKCSSKNLLRVNEVFVKAQQAVLYPFAPLYDLNTGRLTLECRKAFTRIFRMYDQDHDGLLSNAELDNFQYQTFRVPLVERDLAGWKKVVARTSEEQVVRDGKFTVAGFLAIFDVFISQNRLDVPWKVLRKFGYDDNLNLAIPAEDKKKWKLSSSARSFLVSLFHQFDSDEDGKLSPDDVSSLFAIFPDPASPPWHPNRARSVLGDCFSLPRSNTMTGAPSDDPMSLSLTASGITILSSSSLPSMGDLSSSTMRSTMSQQRPMSLLEWMGHWHMISSISPTAARAELYRLGHVVADTPKRKKRRRAQKSDPMLPSEEVQLYVLGSRDSGKPALLRLLCGIETDLDECASPETSCTHVIVKRKKEKQQQDEDEEAVIHFIITQVPEEMSPHQRNELLKLVESTSSKNRKLVVLCFDSDSENSLGYAMNIERQMLHDDIPRVFVANKGTDKAHTIAIAQDHCVELDLDAPLVVDGDDGAERMVVLRHLAGSVLPNSGFQSIKSMPHFEQKKREAERRRKMIWLGSIVSVSVAVAVGVGVLWSSGGAAGERKEGRFSWLTKMIFGTKPAPAETKQAV